MPQMAPLNWASLYMMFSLLFMLLIIVNYYSFLYKPKTNIKHKTQTIPNWKW